MSINKKNKSRINLGLIGSYPPPFGGVSVHIKSLKTYLERAGYSCVVFNSGRNKNISSAGVVNVKGLWDLTRRLFRSNAVLLHIHGGAELYKKLVVLCFLRILFGKRWLVTIHSGGIVKDLQGRSILFKKTLSAVMSRAERIICVSSKIRDCLVDAGVPGKKCAVIPAFSMDQSSAAAVLPGTLKKFLSDHYPLLACLGYSFAPHYGYDLAIRLKRSLKPDYPKTGLVIMGGNKEGDDFQALTDQFEREELHDILFTGDIDHGAALSTIRQSDVFLRPTYHDGDSISVREALAMNVPVVASDTEMRPEEAILFQIGNVEELAEKTRTALVNNANSEKKEKSISQNENLEAVARIYQEIEIP